MYQWFGFVNGSLNLMRRLQLKDCGLVFVDYFIAEGMGFAVMATA